MDRLRHTMLKTMSLQIIVLTCFLLSACSDTAPGITSEATRTAKPDNAARGQRIVVIDRGMNMPIGALTIPSGWSLDYDVFTNSYSGTYDRFLIDIRSPDSMLIRGLGSESYNHYFNQNFNTVVETMVRPGLQGIEGLSFGQFSEDTETAQS